MTSAIDRARDFVLRNGRLLDRYRFDLLLDGGPVEPVVRALRSYQNDDGGFGNAIEPDIRGSASQPVGAEVALQILTESGHVDDDLVDRLCAWCAGAATRGGGLPFALPTIVEGPRASWWEPSDGASLNPTAAVVGLLHRLGACHDWLAGAAEYCWSALAAGVGDLEVHEALCVVELLRSPGDGERADRVSRAVRVRVLDDLVALDPAATGYVISPFDFAPTPHDLTRDWFDDDLVDRHLDALGDGQLADGGWPISWPAPDGAATAEWRAIVTIKSLLTLRSYGRL